MKSSAMPSSAATPMKSTAAARASQRFCRNQQKQSQCAKHADDSVDLKSHAQDFPRKVRLLYPANRWAAAKRLLPDCNRNLFHIPPAASVSLGTYGKH
jgi:hypothetical protein